MTDMDLMEKLKNRLFASIALQIDAIGYVPQDIETLVGDTRFEDTTVGEMSDRKADAGQGEAAAPEALARKVNAYYDSEFYNRDGLMGLLLGETEFRNIGYWDATATNQKDASERLFDELLALIPEKSGRILDVACGMGASTRRLLTHYPADNVHAINISAKQIETTRLNAPGCHAEVMNAVDLRFPDAAFDNILCIEAAFHFETRRKFFEEAHRVLKPGGRLVLSDVLFTSRERLAQYPTLPSPENHVASVEDYRALLADVGFKDIYIRDAKDEVWRRHFMHVVAKVHEDFYERRLNMVQLTEILWAYYHLDAITGPCLLVSARK